MYIMFVSAVSSVGGGRWLSVKGGGGRTAFVDDTALFVSFSHPPRGYWLTGCVYVLHPLIRGLLFLSFFLFLLSIGLHWGH
jgi:hypothetical protein